MSRGSGGEPGVAWELPPADHAGRRGKLRDALREQGLGALVVTGAPNVGYLTGFGGSNGQVLIGVAGDELLVTDRRYEGRAAVECPDLDLALDRDWIGRVAELAGDLTKAEVGFERDHVSFGDGVELQDRVSEHDRQAVPCSGLVERLRERKDDAEIERLELACLLTDRAWEALLGWLRPGVTEVEVARFLERTMADLGADGRSFPTIAASGPNSAIPHHEPVARRIGRGELLKVDFGARVDGYHADMTRTVAMGDTPDELVRVHDLVRDAQERGVEAVAAGAEAAAVDAACREPISEAGYGERFVHGTGHGVGLEIHEAPSVARDASGSLEADHVITVEPGVYLPGLGGVRIEDTVVVTSGGPARRLTNSPRDLVRL